MDRWTHERTELLRKLWLVPKISKEEVLGQLNSKPGPEEVTWKTLYAKAGRLGLSPRKFESSGEAVWTSERIEALTKLWEEGVPTGEMGRRIGVSKNAIIGKVHRLGLVPRLVLDKPVRRGNNPIVSDSPYCMWPIGHPTDDDFHFCGGNPHPGKPYCASHAALAYIRPKNKPVAKNEQFERRAHHYYT